VLPNKKELRACKRLREGFRRRRELVEDGTTGVAATGAATLAVPISNVAEPVLPMHVSRRLVR